MESNMRKLLVMVVGLAALVISSASVDLRAKEAAAFAGTWRLVRIELLGPGGERMAAPAPPALGSANPVGLMLCDAAGRFGVTIMQSGRQKYAAAEPSPLEAQAAFASYIAYFGTYAVRANDSAVTQRIQGSLNPNEVGTERTQVFKFSGGQLTMTTAPQGTNSRVRFVWERAPDLTNPTPTHRRFIGFWQRIATERRKVSGELVSSDRNRSPGVLIFSASGYMAVHSMQAGRKRFAASHPTPEEAKAALNTYGTAYFGPFTIDEADQLEATHQIGVIDPSRVGTYARRHFEFVGSDRLILKPPPDTINGEQVQGFITWERMPPPARSER
jgi:hypothetical protein